MYLTKFDEIYFCLAVIPNTLRFGHWLTLCTLNMHLLTYLLTYWYKYSDK